MASRDVELNLIGHDRTGRATRSAANNLDELKRKVDRFNVDVDRKMRRGGLLSAASFMGGFIGAITAGLRGNLLGALKSPMGKAGAVAGIIFGISLVSAAAAAITAAIPLAFAGGIAALFVKHLAKKFPKAVEGLKAKWQEFLDFTGQPLEVPFLDVIEEIKTGLTKLKGPVRDLMRAIGPALAPFTRGVMEGLVAFVEALKPAMPGIVAGMQAWAKVAPGIGKAVGDMIAIIMSDPKAVVAAIEGIAKAFGFLARAIGFLIAFFSRLFPYIFQLKLLRDMGKLFMKAFQDVWDVIKDWGQRIIDWFKKLPRLLLMAITSLPTLLLTVFLTAIAFLVAAAKRLVARVVAWLKGLPAKARAAIAALPGMLLSIFLRAIAFVVAAAARLVGRVVSALRSLPSKARSAIAGLPSALGGVLSRAANVVAAGVRRINGILAGLKSKTITITTRIRRIFRREFQTSGTPFDPTMLSAGMGWIGSMGGNGHRTGGPSPINVAAPVTNVRVFMDSHEIAAVVRSTVMDENRRAAHRARTGRR